MQAKAMMFHPLLLLLLLPAATYSQKDFHITVCGSRNYTSSGPYETNLRALLFNLMASAAKSQTLFANDTSGDPSSSSQAFGLAQCRPGITVPNCTFCIRRAANTALASPSKGCPLRLSAALRSDDCVLRYSDELFFGSPRFTEQTYMSNTQNASNPEVFGKAVGELLLEVVAEAAAAPAKFAAREKRYDEAVTDIRIYATAWCTQDLSSWDCMQCMQETMKGIKMERIGAHVVAVSCAVKFDTSPFSSFLMLPPDSSLAPVGSEGGGLVSGSDPEINYGKSIREGRNVFIIGSIIAATLTLI